MTTNYRVRQSNTQPAHRAVPKMRRNGWGRYRNNFDIPHLSEAALLKLQLGDHLYRAIIQDSHIYVEHSIVLGPVRPMNQYGRNSRWWYEGLEKTSRTVHGYMYDDMPESERPPYRKAAPSLMIPLQHIGTIHAARSRSGVRIEYKTRDRNWRTNKFEVARALWQVGANIDHTSPSGTLDYTGAKLEYLSSHRYSGVVFCTTTRRAMDRILKQLLTSNYIDAAFEMRAEEIEENRMMSEWADRLDDEEGVEDSLDEPNYEQQERDRELWAREEEREEDAQFAESQRIYDEEQRQRAEDTAEDFPLDHLMTPQEADAWERQASGNK